MSEITKLIPIHFNVHPGIFQTIFVQQPEIKIYRYTGIEITSFIGQ